MASLNFPVSLISWIRENCHSIRLAVFDVDGVLTDGRIYIGEQGEIFKAFSTLDGQGMKLLKQAGIELVIITGRDSPAVRRRMNDLGVLHGYYGIHNKLDTMNKLLQALQLDWTDVAVIGDDWPDLPLMHRAKLSVAPANAHHEVKSAVHHVTSGTGGHGAAREFCDLLLLARGKYHQLLDNQCLALDVSSSQLDK